MAVDDQKERLFEDVVAANRRRLQAIARSYAPPSDRQDLYQEMLLQMWKGLDGFRGKSAPSTWVYRVALNTAITFRRRNGRGDVASSSHFDLEPPGTPSTSGDEVLILDEFLRSLGKIDRAVLLLYFEDLTYRQISEVTGLSEGHVGVRISRLKKTFAGRYCMR